MLVVSLESVLVELSSFADQALNIFPASVDDIWAMGTDHVLAWISMILQGVV